MPGRPRRARVPLRARLAGAALRGAHVPPRLLRPRSVRHRWRVRVRDWLGRPRLRGAYGGGGVPRQLLARGQVRAWRVLLPRRAHRPRVRDRHVPRRARNVRRAWPLRCRGSVRVRRGVERCGLHDARVPGGRVRPRCVRLPCPHLPVRGWVARRRLHGADVPGLTTMQRPWSVPADQRYGAGATRTLGMLLRARLHGRGMPARPMPE